MQTGARLRIVAVAAAVLLTVGWAPALADTGYLPPTVTIPPPDTDGCPQRSTPPPAIDRSEDVPAGSPTPTPLPVPAEPVGGPAMATCGFLLPAGAPAVPTDITAHAWTVTDLTTGAVLGGKDPHGRYRPASTIKLLTALVILRNFPDLTTTVTGTQEDANQEGSKVGVGPGGVYTVRELLYGLMLNSGNDAAFTLARANGGFDKTVAEMNALAASIGALDTRAATVSGLDGPGQQTSAYDLTLITAAALQEPGFAEIISSQTAVFPGFGTHGSFGIANDNKLLQNYPGAIGGKTGFTDDAGNTYVGVAERNGHRLVVTMLAGTQWPRRQWMQAATLLDWGFAVQGAGLNPVGRLVDPAADLTGEASAAPAEPDGDPAAPDDSASPQTGAAPAGGAAADGSPTVATGDSGSQWPWPVWLLLLSALAVPVAILIRRHSPAAPARVSRRFAAAERAGEPGHDRSEPESADQRG